MIDPEIKEVITAFWHMIWDIFVKTEIPYFNINFGQIYIGLFATSAFAMFVKKTLDSEVSEGSGNGDYVKGKRYRKKWYHRNDYMSNDKG